MNIIRALTAKTLHQAARENNVEWATLLLGDKRVDPNKAKDEDDGATPLYIAAQKNSKEVATLLLNDERVDPNKANIFGDTPLHIAAENNSKEVATLLLQDKRVDPNKANDYGWTPLFIAALRNRKEVATLLLNDKRVDPNKAEKNGETPLFVAAKNNNKEMVTLLLKDKRVDPNKAKDDGATPLYIAAQKNSEEVATLLLNDKRVDPNKAKDDGATPLHIAAYNNSKEVATLLLNDERVDPNKVMDGGATPLYIAARNNLKEVATLLLSDERVDPNKATDEGWTPLHVVAKNNSKEVATLLLNDERVDPIKVDANGWTPLVFAMKRRHKRITKLLENAKQRPTSKSIEMIDVDNAADWECRMHESGHPYWFHVPTTRWQWEQPPCIVSAKPLRPGSTPAEATIEDIKERSTVVDVVSRQAKYAKTKNPTDVKDETLDLDSRAMTTASAIQDSKDEENAMVVELDKRQVILEQELRCLQQDVCANRDDIRDHEMRLRDLEEFKQTMREQVDLLEAWEKKPDHLMFCRRLLTSIESLFLSIKAAAGGFVAVGGDAMTSQSLANASKALKVCGVVVSLLPFGSILKGAAGLGQAALDEAQKRRREELLGRLSRALTLTEAQRVACDVANALTTAFDDQIGRLVPAHEVKKGNGQEGTFTGWFKGACGLVGAVLEGEDVGDAVTGMVEDKAVNMLATRAGMIVGTPEEGPAPFTDALADFCFLLILAELEHVRVGDARASITKKLTDAVLCLTVASDPEEGAPKGGGVKLVSGVRKLLKKVAAKGNGKTQVMVFLRSGEEVPVVDLLAKCGVVTKTKEHFLSPSCKPDVFGWMLGTSDAAGARGYTSHRVGGVGDGVAALAVQAQVEHHMRLKSSAHRQSPSPRPNNHPHFQNVDRTQAEALLGGIPNSFLFRSSSNGPHSVSFSFEQDGMVLHAVLNKVDDGWVASGNTEPIWTDLRQFLSSKWQGCSFVPKETHSVRIMGGYVDLDQVDAFAKARGHNVERLALPNAGPMARTPSPSRVLPKPPGRRN